MFESRNLAIGKLLWVVFGVLACQGALSGATNVEELKFEWRGKKVTLEDLTQAQQDVAIDALEVWGPWAEEQGYRLLLSDQCRALLVISGKQASKRWKQLNQAEQFFEEHFLSPKDRQTSEPESDDEYVPLNFDQTIQLVEFRKEQEYNTALKRIREEYPYYSDLDKLKGLSGFLLPRSFIGGWMEQATGVDYWRANNEMINRALVLMQSEKFGTAPLWMRLGTGWFAEFEMTNSLHSFPYRDEFVFVVEHSGYENIVRNLFRKERKALDLHELNDCSPDAFSRDCAAMSWGFVTFLGRYYPGALPAILNDLYDYQKKHRRGGRDADEGFAPTEEQIRVVEKHTSPQVWSLAAEFFQEGKRYKLPKESS